MFQPLSRYASRKIKKKNRALRYSYMDQPYYFIPKLIKNEKIDNKFDMTKLKSSRNSFKLDSEKIEA